MEEPNYITVGQLKKELDKHPDHMPVLFGYDGEDEYVETVESGTVILEDSAGHPAYGVVGIC